jgi:hypothetical protein
VFAAVLLSSQSSSETTSKIASIKTAPVQLTVVGAASISRFVNQTGQRLHPLLVQTYPVRPLWLVNARINKA